MEPTWGRQVSGGPHVGPKNFAICVRPHDIAVYYKTNAYIIR